MPLINEHLILEAADVRIHLVSSLLAPLMSFITFPKEQRSSLGHSISVTVLPAAYTLVQAFACMSLLHMPLF